MLLQVKKGEMTLQDCHVQYNTFWESCFKVVIMLLCYLICSDAQKMGGGCFFRLMPFRPLFPCVLGFRAFWVKLHRSCAHKRSD